MFRSVVGRRASENLRAWFASAFAIDAARPDIDVEGPDYDHISDEDDLARAGGVTSDDRIDVQPWIEKEGRFSFVTSDPKAMDLACFADTKKTAKKGGQR